MKRKRDRAKLNASRQARKARKASERDVYFEAARLAWAKIVAKRKVDTGR